MAWFGFQNSSILLSIPTSFIHSNANPHILKPPEKWKFYSTYSSIDSFELTTSLVMKTQAYTLMHHVQFYYEKTRFLGTNRASSQFDVQFRAI